MLSSDRRLKSCFNLLVVLLGALFFGPAIVQGAPSAGVVKHSVEVLTSGGAYTAEVTNRARAIVTANINEVNELRITNQISNSQYQQCQKSFHDTNNTLLQNSSTKRIKVEMPQVKGDFIPGTDTDAIATVKNRGEKISLDDIKESYRKHQENLREFCRKNGYEPPPGNIDVETDIMPDPECTTAREHSKIAKWINDNGGCAYVDQKAVRVEIKLGKGENVNLTESSAYQQEMRRQIKKQVAKASLAKNPAKIQLANSRSAKYLGRMKKLCNNLRQQHLGSKYRPEITGLDGTIDNINSGNRGPLTRLEAIKVGGLCEQGLQKSSGLYIETMMDVAQVNGLKSSAGKAAGKKIAQELVHLSPSEANVMISQMESRFGAEFTTKVVQDAKTVRKLNQAAESTGAKWVRRAGYAMIAYDGMQRVRKVWSAKDEDKPQLALEEGGSFALGTAGAFGGAAAGAAFGTLICPGPGTAVGTIFGFFWGIKGYIEGDHWGRKMGSAAASAAGVDQNAGQLAVSQSAMHLYNDLVNKGIPKDKALAAAKLLLNGNLKEFKKMIAQIRKDYVTHLEEKLNLENLSEKEMRMMRDCLCHDCGGQFGGRYAPEKGSKPCICSGPLSSWRTPFRTDNKTYNNCINSILRARYNKNQAQLDEMHKEYEAVFQRIKDNALRQIKQENAEAFAEELAQVRQTMLETKTLVNSANRFNRIKTYLLDEDRQQTANALSARLKIQAVAETTKGNLDGAIKYTELAITVKDGDPEKSAELAALKAARALRKLKKK